MDSGPGSCKLHLALLSVYMLVGITVRRTNAGEINAQGKELH